MWPGVTLDFLSSTITRYLLVIPFPVNPRSIQVASYIRKLPPMSVAKGLNPKAKTSDRIRLTGVAETRLDRFAVPRLVAQVR